MRCRMYRKYVAVIGKIVFNSYQLIPFLTRSLTSNHHKLLSLPLSHSLARSIHSGDISMMVHFGFKCFPIDEIFSIFSLRTKQNEWHCQTLAGGIRLYKHRTFCGLMDPIEWKAYTHSYIDWFGLTSTNWISFSLSVNIKVTRIWVWTQLFLITLLASRKKVVNKGYYQKLENFLWLASKKIIYHYEELMSTCAILYMSKFSFCVLGINLLNQIVNIINKFINNWLLH